VDFYSSYFDIVEKLTLFLYYVSFLFVYHINLNGCYKQVKQKILLALVQRLKTYNSVYKICFCLYRI